MLFTATDKLTPNSLRVLQLFYNALTGQPFITVSGVQIAQFQLGDVTLSTGALASPNGLLTGSVGDIFFSTDGGGGGIIFAKTSGTNTNTGWTLVT
jgi:hypothetical protein